MANYFYELVNDRKYNFQQFEFGEESGYHVDVKDEEGTRWEFRLMKQDDEWKILGEKLPSWIYDHEAQLRNVIESHG